MSLKLHYNFLAACPFCERSSTSVAKRTTCVVEAPVEKKPSIYFEGRLSESSGILEGKARISRMQRGGIADAYTAYEV